MFRVLAVVIACGSFLTCEALAPRIACNPVKRAYAQAISIDDIGGEAILIAKYADGTICTILSGFESGYQWIEENGEVVDSSDKIHFSKHSMKHKYAGGEVITTLLDHGTGHSQTVIYHNKIK